MTTSQMVKEVSNWTSTFPNEQSTINQSVQFVKKLLAISISHITYLRAIFPEKAYGDRKLEDVHLKILSENTNCDGALQVIKWVRACFHALDKRYLRQLMIAIYTNPEEPDKVIESYNFRFSYNPEGTKMTCNGENVSSFPSKIKSPELTKKTTLCLLRTLIMLTQSLEPIPENAFLTMKLLYYDEITPADYEPPGFKPAETDDFYFNEEVANIKVGEVATPYHILKLRVKTNKSQFTIEENLLGSQESTLSKTHQEIVDENKEENEINETQDSQISKANSEPMEEGINEVNDTEITEENGINCFENKTIRCPCSIEKEQELMIQCSACKTYQHAICMSIYKKEKMPETHLCFYCKNDQSLNSTQIKEKCLMRQALIYCKNNPVITQASIKKDLDIEKDDIQTIMFYLEDDNYISNGKGKFKGKKVANKNVILKNGLTKYFPEDKPFTQSNDSALLSSNLKRKDNEINQPSKDESQNEIEEITSKTEKMNVNMKKVKPTRKRIICHNKENQSFDINGSQDENEELISCKRRKASVIYGLSV